MLQRTYYWLTALLLILLLVLCELAHAQQWEWAHSVIDNTDGDLNCSVAIDNAGNSLIVAGCNSEAIGGNCSLLFNSNLISKCDASGNFLPPRQIDFMALSIAVSTQGSVYLTGDTTILTRIDENWQRKWWQNGQVFGASVTIDSAGFIYVLGAFIDTVRFDTIALVSSDPAGYVAKYDSTGKCFWAKKFTCSGLYFIPLSITVDNEQNTYITGTFSGQAGFDNINITSLGNKNIFIAKYDRQGNVVWAQRAGQVNPQSSPAPWVGSYGIASSNGAVYIAGSFSDTATFGQIQLIAPCNSSAFLAKYSSSGSVAWAKQYGTRDDNLGRCVTTDAQGNCYIAGGFVGEISFDNLSLNGLGNFDAFVAKIDSAGNAVWAAKAAGKVWNEMATGIALKGNELVVTGYYNDTTYFDNKFSCFRTRHFCR